MKRDYERMLPVVQKYAAQTGWYLPSDLTIGDVRVLYELITSDDHQVFEDMMIANVRSRIDKIELEASELWADRAHLLKDAFDAHRNGVYNLSVPVLLTQADGIGNDLFGVSFYSKDRKGVSKVTGTYKERINPQVASMPVDSVTRMWFLQPLDYLSRLAYNTKDLQSSKEIEALGTLNRHAVIHGLDTTYGTEANSLRAIQLLSYLADLQPLF
jgi:hypothetical protein